MNIRRSFIHFFTPPWRLGAAVSAQALQRIEAAIGANERLHRGEIRFAVESALDLHHLRADLTARERAVQVFSELGIWDTEENNGVLIYLLLADRDFEIVADRGIHRHVGEGGWEVIAHRMEAHFRSGDIERGIVEGIEAVGAHLRTHYPRSGPDTNELPDRPVVV